MGTSVSSQRSVNRTLESQLKLLSLISLYGNLTSRQISYLTNTPLRTINLKLNQASQSRLLIRDYAKSYRLALRPASYSLSGQGLKLLKSNRPKMHHALKIGRPLSRVSRIYHRKAANQIIIVDILSRQTFEQVWTANQLAATKQALYPAPDAFLKTLDTAYFVDYFEPIRNSQFIKRRIERYAEHADSDRWQLTKTYPTILLITESSSLARLMDRWCQVVTDNSWTPDLTYIVKTRQQLADFQL